MRAPKERRKPARKTKPAAAKKEQRIATATAPGPFRTSIPFGWPLFGFDHPGVM